MLCDLQQPDVTTGPTAMRKHKFSNCVCSRISYILATYQPGVAAGINAVRDVCSWWGELGELKEKTNDFDFSMRCREVTSMVLAQVTTQGGRPSNVLQSDAGSAWASAMNFCCQRYGDVEDETVGRFRFKGRVAELGGLLASENSASAGGPGGFGELSEEKRDAFLARLLPPEARRALEKDAQQVHVAVKSARRT
jgi:hypothetical protein